MSILSIILAAAAPDDGGAAKYLQWILPGIFGGGLLGAVGLLLRFRPEATSAAVIQANTAMEGMGKLIDELKEDREELQKTVAKLTEEVARLTEEVRQWRTTAEELQSHHDSPED